MFHNKTFYHLNGNTLSVREKIASVDSVIFLNTLLETTLGTTIWIL